MKSNLNDIDVLKKELKYAVSIIEFFVKTLKLKLEYNDNRYVITKSIIHHITMLLIKNQIRFPNYPTSHDVYKQLIDMNLMYFEDGKGPFVSKELIKQLLEENENEEIF